MQDAITALERWNLSISSDGRLRIAQQHLIKVADSGSYGETEEELIQTAKAAFLAKDFYKISTALNKERDNPIAEELMRALEGTLDGKTEKNDPYAIQSQYWAGRLFAQSGLRPAVPSTLTRV